MKRIAAILFFVACLTSLVANADIYRWDNGQVIPGTEGITPGPNTNLSGHSLAYAQLSDTDFHGSTFDYANLTSARFDRSNLSTVRLDWSNLSGASLRAANLSGANLYNAVLTDADFTGSIIQGVEFMNLPHLTSGLAKEQLYSTASHQAKDLSGISLGLHDLSGWDFEGQNLSNAQLSSTILRVREKIT